MKPRYDLAIVGAGPGGMAAAALAAELELSVAVFDEQPLPGGQIYRNIERSPLTDRSILGPDYYHGEQFAKSLRASGVDYLSNSTVWQVSPAREIGVSRDGAAHLVTADQVIFATGALERPFPVPGWTLPGVMTAGGAQVLLKSAGVAGESAVFAGTGPLLYLIAWQYARAGVKIKAVLDTTPRGNYLRTARHMAAAMRSRGYLAKGLSLLRDIRRSGITRITGVDALRAVGDDRLEGVSYQRGGSEVTLDTDLLFLHQGVVPNVNLSMSTGCAHDWEPSQLCWRPRVDGWGRTSLDWLMVAGDGAGIGGAVAAEMSGQISALAAAERVGRIDAKERDRRAVPLKQAIAADLRIRPFLEALYRPAPQFRIPKDPDQIVCRCEEITVAQIRSAIEQGCPGPNQLKSFTRCGMGPCQGRLCGLTVSELIAAERGVPVPEVGYYRLRPPIKPLSLGELAALAPSTAEVS